MEDFEIREGTVLTTGPDTIVVRVDAEEDCGGCRSCAVKALCRGRDDNHMDLPVKAEGAARPEPGERVRIAFRGTNPAVAALVMFVPALLGLFFGGFAGHRLFGESDGMFLAGCLGGLVIGLLATLGLYRMSPSFRPVAKLLT